MNTESLYSLFLKCKNLSTDTRNISPHSLFFGIKGEKFNGNEFAKKAIDAGARYAIVDEKEFEDEENNIFLVKDSLEALQELAKHHRRELKTPIIALTGSNGKTTTKELITRVLSQKYKVISTVGNLNNHIGVPLTILSINHTHEVAVVEMGANHQKEIEFLCSLAEPDFGYITNFGKAHLEGFGGMEGVIKGKSELYHYLRKNEKKAFVNWDDGKQIELTEDMDILSFGTDPNADFRFQYGENFDGKCPELIYNSKSIQSQLIGQYNISNVAAAVAIGLYFKVPIEKIKKAVKAYDSGDNRSQILITKKHQVILDAYNANPSSMEEALKNFSLIEGEKAVVLGDMFELGKSSAFEHLKIGELAYEMGFDSVYLIGSHFSQIELPRNPNIHLFKNREEAENYLKRNPIRENRLLIKGSRGMALEKLMDIF